MELLSDGTYDATVSAQIMGDVDVLVAGGGTAGTAGALCAASDLGVRELDVQTLTRTLTDDGVML